MSPECGERLNGKRVCIEFSSTPYRARGKFILHNAIEDMIAERVGKKGVERVSGFSEFGLPDFTDSNTRSLELNEIFNLQRTVLKSEEFDNIVLLDDGVFTGLSRLEILRRAGVINDNDAKNFSLGLIPLLKSEDLIILTLVSPRAALSREMIPPYENGLREKMQIIKMIKYAVFNQSAKAVLEKFKQFLPKIITIEPEGDVFARDEIFFSNAEIVLASLGLESIDEWSEKIRKDSRLKAFGRGLSTVSGRTLAGLTRSEIVRYLEQNDWSQDPAKKERIINIFEQHIRPILDYVIDSWK